MAAHSSSESEPKLDLSKYRNLPLQVAGAGAVLLVLGVAISFMSKSGLGIKQFAFSWLLAFMFYLSIMLGGLFLTILHHLFDASWSVPIRRITEHLANLSKPMVVLWLPIGFLATTLYAWMNVADPEADHALFSKQPLFTKEGFYITSAVCLGLWILFSHKLRHYSLKQDQDGSFECTRKMRQWACVGILVFAVTLTFGCFMWMKALEYQWFSTMFGVYYFAGSVWLTIATVYLITLALKRTGPLKDLAGTKQFYFLGSLLFAFTVFYSYIHFSQYFIIWNGNMPEETFFYLRREQGMWYETGIAIIFGHFFIPFLALLRIDVKLKAWFMIPVIAWAWLMHYVDLSFNIMPMIHPTVFVPHLTDIGAMLLMGGFLASRFLKDLNSHPIFPQKDPRMTETLGVYVQPLSEVKAAHGGAK
ncbi:MAG: hypothetical protein AB1705_17925 [Verrucomicrobiota bacterium]